MYDLINLQARYKFFCVTDLREITLTHKRGHVKCHQKWRNKQLPAHSVSIEIYSGIAQFPCDSTAFFLNFSLTTCPLYFGSILYCITRIG